MAAAEGEAASGMSLDKQNLWHAMGRMRRLMVVVFCYETLRICYFWILSSHLRTLVHCPPALPDKEGQCPSGSFFHDGRCAAAPRGSRDWSFSNHCSDKAYVVGTATEYKGKMALVNGVATIVGVTVLGPQLDVWGRKPLFMLSLVTSFLGVGLVLASTFVMDASSKLGVTFASVTVVSIADVAVPAVRAAVADMSKSTTVDRSAGFAAIHMAYSMGRLAALAACTGILHLDLAEYRLVWFVFCLLAVCNIMIAATVLRETLPQEPPTAMPGQEGKSPADVLECQASTPAVGSGSLPCPRRRYSLRAVTQAVPQMGRQVARAYGLARQDPFLGHVSVICGLLGGTQLGLITTMGSYLLEALGYSQAMTQIPGAVYPLFALMSVGLCPRFVKYFGPALTAEAGMLLAATGLALLGLSALCTEMANTLFWIGFCILAFGATFPLICLITIMSTRVNAYSQGQLDAFMQVVWLVFRMLGAYVWSNFFYAEWRSGLIFWPGTAMILATMLWFAMVHCRWPVPPVGPGSA